MGETSTAGQASKSTADNLTEWLPDIAAAVRTIKHGRIELTIFGGRITELQTTQKIRKD